MIELSRIAARLAPSAVHVAWAEAPVTAAAAKTTDVLNKSAAQAITTTWIAIIAPRSVRDQPSARSTASCGRRSR